MLRIDFPPFLRYNTLAIVIILKHTKFDNLEQEIEQLNNSLYFIKNTPNELSFRLFVGGLCIYSACFFIPKNTLSNPLKNLGDFTNTTFITFSPLHFSARTT